MSEEELDDLPVLHKLIVNYRVCCSNVELNCIGILLERGDDEFFLQMSPASAEAMREGLEVALKRLKERQQ